MLMRRYRLIYLVSLIFSLYWLLVLNQTKFVTLDGEFATQGWLRMGGVLLLLITLFCFSPSPTTSRNPLDPISPVHLRYRPVEIVDNGRPDSTSIFGNFRTEDPRLRLAGFFGTPSILT